jgi:hypothetical protein
MTKAWGPLGWATLHSVAAIYPSQPSALERSLLQRWMEAFRRCITCEKCRSHFTEFLQSYTAQYPDWSSSSREVSLLAMRAHNTVNARLGTPVYNLDTALALMRSNIPPDRAALMRQSYLVYVHNHWKRDISLTGISGLKLYQDLLLTEQTYWSHNGFSWDSVAANCAGASIDVPPRVSTIAAPKPNYTMKPQPFKLGTSKIRMSFVSR